MLKFTKVALATLLSAFLLLSGMGCQYLDSATGSVESEVSTQKGAPVAEPTGGVSIVKVTVVYMNFSTGKKESEKTYKLSELESFLKNNKISKAYWDEAGHDEIDFEELDESSFETKRTIYIDSKYMPKPSAGEGEEGGEGTPSSSITVTAKMVYGGSAFTSYSLSLSEIQAYASKGLKAYWNEGLTEEVTNVNQLKDGDIIYISYSDYMQAVSLSGNI